MSLQILVEVFTVYILTNVIVNGHGMDIVRRWCRKYLWFLSAKIPGGQKANGFSEIHLIDCRFCTGLWVSLVVCWLYGDTNLFFLIYGGSYFLATQEKI